jgi:hypothetical protein
LPALRDVHLLVNVLHSDVLVSPGSLEAACALVGRFQYHFGRVEQKIDQLSLSSSILMKRLDPSSREAMLFLAGGSDEIVG